MPADEPEGVGQFYGRWLDAELRAALANAPGTLDLENEIKMIRVVAAWLGANLAANHPHMIRTIGVLLRAVGIQAKAAGENGEMETALRAVAERMLDELERVDGTEGGPA